MVDLIHCHNNASKTTNLRPRGRHGLCPTGTKGADAKTEHPPFFHSGISYIRYVVCLFFYVVLARTMGVHFVCTYINVFFVLPRSTLSRRRAVSIWEVSPFANWFTPLLERNSHPVERRLLPFPCRTPWSSSETQTTTKIRLVSGAFFKNA